MAEGATTRVPLPVGLNCKAYETCACVRYFKPHSSDDCLSCGHASASHLGDTKGSYYSCSAAYFCCPCHTSNARCRACSHSIGHHVDGPSSMNERQPGAPHREQFEKYVKKLAAASKTQQVNIASMKTTLESLQATLPLEPVAKRQKTDSDWLEKSISGLAGAVTRCDAQLKEVYAQLKEVFAAKEANMVSPERAAQSHTDIARLFEKVAEIVDEIKKMQATDQDCRARETAATRNLWEEILEKKLKPYIAEVAKCKQELATSQVRMSSSYLHLQPLSFAALF
jgi:hypothetical protein